MKHLLLLHGALGSADDLNPLQRVLEDSFVIHRLHFTGHGGTSLPQTPFSVSLFAQDVLDYLEQQQLEVVNIFGYSMGGYVGMYLARHYAHRIMRIATLGTKFTWTEAIAAKETGMMDPERIKQKVPAFAQQLQQKHAPQNWEEVMKRTVIMLTAMGASNPLQPQDYAAIGQPVLVLSGDRDKMVHAEETIAVYKQLPNGSVGILPATPHALEQADTALLAGVLKKFFG